MQESSHLSQLNSWDLFVLRHRHRGNLIIHFLSMLCFFLGPVLWLATGHGIWGLAFFSSGILGALGHYLFRDGGVSVKEATHSPLVITYVPKMFYLIFLGRYRNEIKRAEEKLNGH